MSKQPNLQTLLRESFNKKSTTSEDEARLDIKANGVWGTRFNKTYFDVKAIINLLAKSCPKGLKDSYSYHEKLKKLKYETRMLEVESATFVPLIFACSGGAGRCARRVRTRIAAKTWAVRQRHDVHPHENQLRAPEKYNTLHKRLTIPQTCKYHRGFHRNDSWGGEAAMIR